VSPRWWWEQREPPPSALDRTLQLLQDVTEDLRDEVKKLRAVREQQERGDCAGPQPG
jgi:hypothetical protein